NPGRLEAFQFGEADRTLVLGGDLGGKKWHRPDDRIGLAFGTNALTDMHRTYLELGGTSYLLGDGGLNYSREKVIESYYNFRVRPGIFFAFDIQHVRNPAYNADRGPVWIFGVRLHLEGGLHFN